MDVIVRLIGSVVVRCDENEEMEHHFKDEVDLGLRFFLSLFHHFREDMIVIFSVPEVIKQ